MLTSTHINVIFKEQAEEYIKYNYRTTREKENMTRNQLVKIKARIDVFDRRNVAAKLGMRYDLLTKKLNGFAVLFPAEQLRIETVLEHLENERGVSVA
jgi:hypothetical protein